MNPAKILHTADTHLRLWHIWMMLGLVAALDIYLVGVSAPTLSEMAGGRAIFDMRLSYSTGAAERLLVALGEAGREVYSQRHIPVDMAFAVVEWAAISAVILWVTRAGSAGALAESWRLAMLLPPIAQMAFDIAENSAVWAMLVDPGAVQSIAPSASAFTSLKWISAGLAISLALFLCVRYLTLSRRC
jgi:hypothetical protein